MTENPDPTNEPFGEPEQTGGFEPAQESLIEARYAPNGQTPFEANAHAPKKAINAWVVMDLLLHRWHWLVLGSVICAGCFYLLGVFLIKPKYTATAQLLRLEVPGKNEYFKTAPISGETFAGMLKSPDLLRKVGDQVVPPIPPEALAKFIKIDPEPDSDLVKIQLAGRDPVWTITVLNCFASNAVDYIQGLEGRQASALVNNYLTQELAKMDEDIKSLQNEFRKTPNPGVSSNGVTHAFTSFTQVGERLRKALEELDELRTKYQDIHPLVQNKLTVVSNLQAELDRSSRDTNSVAAAAWSPSTAGRGDGLNPDFDIIHIKMRALEDRRIELANRTHEAELYALKPPETVRVFAPADLKTIKTNMRQFKTWLATIFGGCLGFGGAMALVFLVEFVDDRLKTADDVTRVTKLPVLTSLGNLHDMQPPARAQWAFRAWTMLQGRLSRSANHGLVCGITSSAAGEGRSTWISLLAEAASMTGFRVLTIATRPSPTHTASTNESDEPAHEQPVAEPESEPVNQTEAVPAHKNGMSHTAHQNGNSANALTTSVLAFPGLVTDKLTGPNSQPMVHIPLPGWAWNLERRKQWREALNHWRQIENLVIFVELPPACVAEAVLLGSNLPNLVWLADSGRANAGETRAQLETLRHARCNLVGAVLNHKPGVSLRERFPRWLTVAALLTAGTLGLAHAAESESGDLGPRLHGGHSTAPVAQPQTQPAISQPAATVQQPTPSVQQPTTVNAPENPIETAPANVEPAPAPTEAAEASPTHANLHFSVVNPSQRAAWQQRLTLGPGDVMTVGLYGQPEMGHSEVIVGPDGRITYLEAQDVLVTGLTVDELRAKLDQELGKYRRGPRSIITPVAFRSKKYYMLGKVNTKGVFTLDKPLTILEALARAKGLENGLVDRNIVDLADYQRSFLARGGKRIPLDFEKLFTGGDLSQNISIEPDDYIYFASVNVPEVYVVGEIRQPGAAILTPDMNIIAAVAARGGYTERAFRARVLVIRGSLSQPERLVVDTHAILDGKGVNFKLKPGDIVYVNSRPFIKVEELADMATTAFIQSVITEWTGAVVLKPR